MMRVTYGPRYQRQDRCRRSAYRLRPSPSAWRSRFPPIALSISSISSLLVFVKLLLAFTHSDSHWQGSHLVTQWGRSWTVFTKHVDKGIELAFYMAIFRDVRAIRSCCDNMRGQRQYIRCKALYYSSASPVLNECAICQGISLFLLVFLSWRLFLPCLGFCESLLCMDLLRCCRSAIFRLPNGWAQAELW